MSALHRMAFGAHRQVDLGPGDLVIISASPVPGNEKTVSRMIDELFRRGCDVVYKRLTEIHVSGHACQEELKIILALTRPLYFIPLHGEYRMMKMHAALAAQTGVPYCDIAVPELGRTVEISEKGIKQGSTVPSGKALVDGIAGGVGEVVLRDRQHLATDGILMVVAAMDSSGESIVAGPDIITRGFAASPEYDAMMEELRRLASDTLEDCLAKRRTDWTTIKQTLRQVLSAHLNRKQKRKPLILPVIMEV